MTGRSWSPVTTSVLRVVDGTSWRSVGPVAMRRCLCPAGGRSAGAHSGGRPQEHTGRRRTQVRLVERLHRRHGRSGHAVGVRESGHHLEVVDRRHAGNALSPTHIPATGRLTGHIGDARGEGRCGRYSIISPTSPLSWPGTVWTAPGRCSVSLSTEPATDPTAPYGVVRCCSPTTRASSGCAHLGYAPLGGRRW